MSEGEMLSKAGLVGFRVHEKNCTDQFMPVTIDITSQNMDELALDFYNYNPDTLEFFCKRKKPKKDKNFVPCIELDLDKKSDLDVYRARKVFLLLERNNLELYPHFSYMSLVNEKYEFDIYASFLEAGTTDESLRIYLSDNVTRVKFENGCYE